MVKVPSSILHVAPSLAQGGRETRVVALMDRMPRPVRHLVLSLNGQVDCLARVSSAVDVEVIEPPAVLRSGPLARLRAMREMLRTRRPDLLLTYNWGSIEWLLAARLESLGAVVHHEDGFGPEESNRQLRRRIWFRRLLLPVCQAVVVPSRVLRDLAVSQWRQPESRVLLLPNGVDLERFHAGPAEPRDEFVFGCVGRFRPEKNQALAVEAFARAACRDRAHLLLVGDGTDLEPVRALARELGVADRVEFVGAVDDPAPLYRRMDAFVNSSRTEQMPISVVEAMATALPIVGTDVGDVKEMVAQPNRDLIVASEDRAALSAAMERVAGDPGFAHELGRANRRRAEQEYDIDACYGAYVRLYRDVAALMCSDSRSADRRG